MRAPGAGKHGEETWVHPDTGMVATTSLTDAGHGLSLGQLDGERCSASLAFLALADFDLLDAVEEDSPLGPLRCFRLAGRG